MDKLSKKGSKISELIEKGREQGYLTYADVNDHLPDDISDPDQVEEIIGMINDLGLQVHETAPDADEIMLAESEDSDDVALEQAAAALAAVENETGRTTDPVRMYMREMGTVDLLTREGEIEIAKRIEEGMRDLLNASVAYPTTVAHVIDYFQMVKDGEKKINDLLTGFLEEMEEVPSAGPGSERAKAEEEEDEKPNGPDMEEVQRRMTNLKRQYNKTLKVIDSKGISSKDAKAEYEKSEKSMRYQLIEGKVITENKLQVNMDDIKSYTKEMIINQMLQYGQANPGDKELEDIVTRVLSNQDEVKRISEQLTSQKILSFFKENVNLKAKKLSYEKFVKEVYGA